MCREMKDTGIEWIGIIPEEWSTSKLIRTLRTKICDGPHETPNYVEDGIPFISIDSLNQTKYIDFSVCKRFITEEDYVNYSKKTVIENGDILFSKAATIGKTAIVGDQKFMVWSPLAIIKSNPKLLDNQYLYYLLNCSELIVTVSLNGSMNTQVNVGMRELEQIYIPLPCLLEQRLIANFLDEKVSKIDEILEKNRQSIEEYKKLKQAIITEAVTKGLDPDVEMKDSGNQWFGSIPKHWEMNKTKYMFSIRKTIAGKEGYEVLSITQKGIKPKDISKNEGQMASNYSNYQLVAPGDFAMNHMDLLTGWVDISNYNGVTSPDYRVFKLIDESNNCKKYYLYLMQMCYFNRIYYGLGQGVSGMGRWRLQSDKFLNFGVTVPPLNEQVEIEKHLDRKCSEIDLLITEKENLIQELDSYKKSLIYEYVTGKKEVKQSADN